jgi:hypothetical protein
VGLVDAALGVDLLTQIDVRHVDDRWFRRAGNGRSAQLRLPSRTGT